MKTINKFCKEFKLKAVEMSNNSDWIKDVAFSLGIQKALLYRWRKEFYEKGWVFSDSGITSTLQDAEKEELRRLRKKNRNLKLERDILKKAVGIFSKNDWNDMNLSKLIALCFQFKRRVKSYV